MSQTVPKVQGIYSVYIISKSGGLIYNYDVESSFPVNDVEKTFSFPLDIHLEYVNQRLVVSFGQRDNIKGKQQCFEVLPLLKLPFPFSGPCTDCNQWSAGCG